MHRTSSVKRMSLGILELVRFTVSKDGDGIGWVDVGTSGRLSGDVNEACFEVGSFGAGKQTRIEVSVCEDMTEVGYFAEVGSGGFFSNLWPAQQSPDILQIGVTAFSPIHPFILLFYFSWLSLLSLN